MNPILYYIILHYIILEEMPLAGSTQPFGFFSLLIKLQKKIYILKTDP